LRAEGRLLRAAVVLFGRRLMPDYPQCALRMARFKGTTKTEFLDNRQLHGHAFHILDEAMHFILRNIPIAGRIEAGKLERQDAPLYPPLALREALVNALCHRDYAIAGGAVNVASIRAHPSAFFSGLGSIEPAISDRHGLEPSRRRHGRQAARGTRATGRRDSQTFRARLRTWRPWEAEKRPASSAQFR
jgi:ATP-dependent DNA helicase RecG